MGNDKEKKGTVTAEYGAYSPGEDLARLGKISAERFSAKQSEHTYEKGTVLIIQLDFHRSISHDEFNLIYGPLREVISLHGCQFAEVHVFNSYDNELRRAR